jgi:RNA 3'-phosphate cyclase
MDTLEVDGSFGEGGGQILRSAVAFSIILGRPIHVTNVRAGRELPGLRPQHAASLRILRDISGSTLEGGEIGSTEVRFYPKQVESAEMKVDLKTAASLTLLLQAVVPAASLSGSRLQLDLVGGTDVPWSPTMDYFQTVTSPALKLLGIESKVEVLRRGYYPRGGGRVRARIEPCSVVRALNLTSAGRPPSPHIVSRFGRLPRHVADRQAQEARRILKTRGTEPASVSIFEEQSDSPGSSILVSSIGEQCFLGSDSIGARGKSSESVGRDAAQGFLREADGSACIDSHLADALAPLLALAKSESRILVSFVTEHLKTGLYVAKLFTDCEFNVVREKSAWLLTITPSKHKL